MCNVQKGKSLCKQVVCTCIIHTDTLLFVSQKGFMNKWKGNLLHSLFRKWRFVKQPEQITGGIEIKLICVFIFILEKSVSFKLCLDVYTLLDAILIYRKEFSFEASLILDMKKTELLYGITPKVFSSLQQTHGFICN